MGQKMKVDICLNGHDLNCKNTLSKLIADKLSVNKIEFHEHMARVSQQYDNKADVLMDSFIVKNVDLSEQQGRVAISYQWQAYHDFEDIKQQSNISDCWNFDIIDKKAIFKVDLPEVHVVHEI